MRNTYIGFMRKLLGIALLVTPLLGQAQAPGFTWAKQAQGVYGGSNSDNGQAIAVDGSGNSYVTGFFIGNINFSSTTLNSSGFGDIFVAKYNSAGAVVWAVKAGGSNFDEAYGIAVDGSGNSYITGVFQGSATFGSLTISTSASNQRDVFVAKFDASGNAVWVRKGGGTSDDYGYGIAVDGSGNSYITGTFEGSALFGSTTLTSAGDTDIFAAKYDAAGTLVWAKRFGGTDYDDAAGIGVDASGNSYITGYLWGTATYGSITLTSANQSIDTYILKLDAAGSAVWARRAGGDDFDSAYGIAVDGLGNSYVTGYFQGIATFGATTLTSAGDEDIYVAKYNSAGTLQWASRAGGTGGERGLGIAADANGNSYITGEFYGTTTFGPNTLTSTPGGYYDLFVAKFDASGNAVWAQGTGDAVTDKGLGIAADASGNSYVTGYFQGTVSFGNTTLTSGAEDIFVVKYSTSGTAQWATNPTGFSTEDVGQAIAADAAGNSYVTGYFNGSMTIGSITLTSSGNADIFVAKYNSAGTVIWARKAGGTGTDEGTGIAVDGSGNSYVTGKFTGSATFGGTTFTSSGDVDLFLVKYDAAGTVLWARQAGGASYDYSKGIAVDASGNSSITGYFEGSATFGNTTLNSVYDDIFVARYDATGTLLWAHKAGGGNQDQGRSIAVDGSGNTYVTGVFINNATFGSFSLSTPNNFNESLFVAKYDASGTVLWATKVAGSDRVEGYGIAVDASSNSYVVGEFWGNAFFGGTTITRTGVNDAFIAKFSAAGTPLWANKAGGSGQEWAYSVAVDPNGNSFMTGTFYNGNITFGSTTLTNSGLFDMYVAKYDAAGNVIWAQKPGSSLFTDSKSIALDASGNSYLTGSFSGTTTFGSTTLTTTGAELFITKISATHTISTGTISPTAYCQGGNLSVPFTATGAYNTGNVFTVQLSDASGSFTSPTTIGTLTGTTSGTISASIPASQAAGNNYRIRVVASDPATTGTDNGSNLTINAPPVISATANPATICQGSSSLLTASGADSYSWHHNGAATASVSVSPSATTTYSVTGTTNGCTAISAVTVNQASTPVAGSSVVTNVACFNGSNGAIDLTPSGGTTPYTFNWGGGITTEDRTSLTANTYSVVITDANGCTATVSATVNQPASALSASSSQTNATCTAAGSATISASGGTAPYTGTGTFTGLAAGTYSYTVTDANNCTATTSVIITQTGTVTASASSNSPVTSGNTIFLSATGGSSYTWSGPAGFSSFAQNPQILNATAVNQGTYTVTVTSGVCSATATVSVIIDPAIAPCTTAMNGTYTINPTMATGGTNFQSFAAAVTALQTIGVCAPVVMQISAGTYTAPFVLGAIPGTSATNTVTFEGNGATIGGCQGSALVSLTHTKHVTISNLTLAPTCDMIGIRLGGSIENVTLSGNTVNLLPTALGTNKSIGLLVDAPMGSVSLLNNTIRNGFVGMWARNTNAPIIIEGNKLYNAYAYGILLQNLMADRDPAVANSGVLVNSNRVRMSSTAHPNAQGIRANYIGGGFMMNSNYINRSPLMAINLANANQAGTVRAEVINNRMGGDAPNSSGGIGIYNVDNLNLLHNSIVGETRILLSENLDVRNNSFVSVDASQYAYMGTTVSNSYLQLNNNYYANTATNGNFVGVETLYLNMPQLQQGYQGVVTYNQNSIGGMGYPYTDSLRITDASPLFNAGMMAGVVVDFEGQTRPDGAGVDIGADEYISFTPPRLAAATLSAEVYPNPFHNNLTVKLTAAEAGAVQVVVSDLMGRQVMSRSYTTEAGARILQLQVEQQLPQGVYLLQVTQGEATSTFRVVKQ